MALRHHGANRSRGAIATIALGGLVAASLVTWPTTAQAAALPSECTTWDSCTVSLTTADADGQAHWTVPAGATDIVFTAKGANGGGGSLGGNIQGEPTVGAVSAGDEFVMFVGAAGTGTVSTARAGSAGGLGAGKGGNAVSPGNSRGGGGGGAGAFIFRGDGTGAWEPFLIAGGGGGESGSTLAGGGDGSPGGGGLDLNGGTGPFVHSRNGQPGVGGTPTGPGAGGARGATDGVAGGVGRGKAVATGTEAPYTLSFTGAATGNGGNGGLGDLTYGGAGGGGGGGGYYGGGGGGGGDDGTTGQGWEGGPGGGGAAYVDTTLLNYGPADTVPAGDDSAVVITFSMAGANVTASNTSAYVGLPVTLSAGLSCYVDGDQPAAGVVVFRDGGTLLGTTVVASGATTASISYTPTAAGTPTVTADYSPTGASAPCSVGSTTFTLTVTDPTLPSVTTQPVGATIAPGDDHTLTVAGAGDPTPTVQWQSSETGDTWSDIAGATSVSYTASTTGLYRAVFTNFAGTATSDSAALVVDGTAPEAPVIDAPTTGTLTNSPDVTIRGTGEADSTITVLNGTDVICTVTADGSGDWSCPLVTVGEGLLSLTATSTDSVDNVSPASSAVSVRIDLTAPDAPDITSPSTGDTTASTAVAGTAEAGSTVRLSLDGSVVCTATADGAGAWQCPALTVNDGEYDLTATATDGAGNVSDPSVTVTVTFDQTAPDAPVIVAPLPGLVTDTSVVSGTAEADSTVELSLDETVACTVTADQTGAWECPALAVEDTEYDLTATATDSVGNVSDPSAPVTVWFDLTAPDAPVITSPVSGTRTNSAQVAGTAEALSSVELSVDGPVVCTATTDAAGSWQCPDLVLTEGEHALTARAIDQGTHVSPVSETVIIWYDTSAPVVPVVTSPTPGSLTNSPVIAGTAEPGSTVTVTIGGREVCTVTVDDSGAWECTVTDLPDGEVVADVSVTDEAGNTTSITTEPFTLDTIAPQAPTFISPKPGTVLDSGAVADLAGGAEPGSTVVVTSNFQAKNFSARTGDIPVARPLSADILCTTTADAQGAWSCTTSVLPDGAYTLVARATDLAGNTSVASSDVRLVVGEAPRLAFTGVLGLFGLMAGGTVLLIAGAVLTYRRKGWTI